MSNKRKTRGKGKVQSKLNRSVRLEPEVLQQIRDISKSSLIPESEVIRMLLENALRFKWTNLSTEYKKSLLK